ncbi:Protein SRT-28 a, partial [Aphelenchoides avenae]
ALYIPCLIAISKHLNQSCYQFMFYIGVVDVVCLWVNGFFTGYFAITGYVFCSHPDFIYLLGVTGLSLWIAESTAAIMLASSRCLEMWSPYWGRLMTSKRLTLFWLLIPTVCAVYFAIWTKPVLFTGLYVSWFFNPHVGYLDSFNPEVCSGAGLGAIQIQSRFVILKLKTVP